MSHERTGNMVHISEAIAMMIESWPESDQRSRLLESLKTEDTEVNAKTQDNTGRDAKSS